MALASTGSPLENTTPGRMWRVTVLRCRRPALDDVREEGRVGDAEARGVDVREDGEPAGVEGCLGIERVVELAVQVDAVGEDPVGDWRPWAARRRPSAAGAGTHRSMPSRPSPVQAGSKHPGQADGPLFDLRCAAASPQASPSNPPLRSGRPRDHPVRGLGSPRKTQRTTSCGGSGLIGGRSQGDHRRTRHGCAPRARLD